MHALLVHHDARVIVNGAEADKAEIQHETKLQEQALDGISDALDDLEMMSKVQPQRTAAEKLSCSCLCNVAGLRSAVLMMELYLTCCLILICIN